MSVPPCRQVPGDRGTGTRPAAVTAAHVVQPDEPLEGLSKTRFRSVGPRRSPRALRARRGPPRRL